MVNLPQELVMQCIIVPEVYLSLSKAYMKVKHTNLAIVNAKNAVSYANKYKSYFDSMSKSKNVHPQKIA